MLLPDKTRKLSRSVIGMGAHIISMLRNPQTVSSLWEKTRSTESVLTFEDFVLTVDFLFALGLLVVEDGIIRKTK